MLPKAPQGRHFGRRHRPLRYAVAAARGSAVQKAAAATSSSSHLFLLSFLVLHCFFSGGVVPAAERLGVGRICQSDHCAGRIWWPGGLASNLGRSQWPRSASVPRRASTSPSSFALSSAPWAHWWAIRRSPSTDPPRATAGSSWVEGIPNYRGAPEQMSIVVGFRVPGHCRGSGRGSPWVGGTH